MVCAFSVGSISPSADRFCKTRRSIHRDYKIYQKSRGLSSLALKKPASFLNLPHNQSRHVKQQIATAAHDGQRGGNIGRKTKHMAEQHEAGFLHAQRAGHGKSGACRCLNKRLDHESLRERKGVMKEMECKPD